MNTDWRRVSFLLAFQVVLFACAPRMPTLVASKTIIPSPSTIVSLTPLFTPTQTARAVTSTARVTPTKIALAPTRTRPPLPEILKIYPLVLGMTRVYSGSIEELSLNSANDLEVTMQWIGVATETIKTLSYSNKQWRLVSTWSYNPQEAEGIKLDLQSEYFVDEKSAYITGGIYNDAEVKWPLEVGQKWDERNFVDTGISAGTPYWRVDGVHEANSILGQSSYCYSLGHYRATSFHGITFCPNFGIVQLVSSYPNWILNSKWDLVKIIAP